MTFTQDPPLQHDPNLENVQETLKQMRRLERTTYKRHLDIAEPFNGLWRQQIVEWMYTLVKFCKLRHESAAAGSYFLDVAVSRGLIRSSSDYQLGAMTALYLGLKVFDSPSMRVVKLGSLVKLGNGEFGEKEVIQMERQLLLALEWRLNPPTPNCFLQQYLLLLPQDTRPEIRNKIEEVSLRAIEACVSRDHFLATLPSVLGFAAMLSAFDEIYQSDMSLLQLQAFLHSMAVVAKLDTANQTLNRASIMLDRTMNSLPIPSAPMVECGEDCDSEQLQYQQSVVADGFSPNYVGL